MAKSMYVIVPTVDVTTKMVNLSTATSIEDLRKSADGSLCILRLEIPVPDFFLEYELYYHVEILEEIAKAEWQLG